MAFSRRTIAAVAVAVTAGAGVSGAIALMGDRSSGDGGSDRSAEPADDDVPAVQPGAPGEPSRELTDEEVAGLGVPQHTAADTAFMQRMLVHHAQALAMADLVADRSDTADIPLLAERVRVSQEAEMAQVEQWLTDRDEEVPAVDDHTTTHDAHEPMPGMATPEQLEALASARGPAFDTLFLELMIAHHQGAVTMVDELYAAGGGVEPAADGVARDIEADQSVEIARMNTMLAARR